MVLVVKAGIDALGEGEMDLGDVGAGTESGDVDTGFSAGAELLIKLDSFMLGAGASYLFPRSTEDDDGKFTLVPVYGVVQLPFASGTMTPFLTLHLGYNFFYLDSKLEDEFESEIGVVPDTEGGFYWAIGGGILLSNNIQIEIIYATHNAAFVFDEADIDIPLEYTHVTISLGYRF